MSRATRQSKILSIIAAQDIERQENLVDELRKAGFHVTQATVSRDIKELGLVKTPTSNNRYKYATKQSMDVKLSGKMLNVVREAVISVVSAENMVVIKTIDDSAAAVSNALEQLSLSEIVGIVADRNTVLVICASGRDAEIASQKIGQLL